LLSLLRQIGNPGIGDAPAWRFGWLDRQPRYPAFFIPSPSFPHSSCARVIGARPNKPTALRTRSPGCAG
jgi:hypothetical protein